MEKKYIFLIINKQLMLLMRNMELQLRILELQNIFSDLQIAA